jgi:tetratricopeptide (TPR) repeat protein
MTGSQDRFQQAMNQGHSAAWDQNWEEAVRYYQQALEEFPGHPKALTSLGLALVEMQRYEEALACYRRASTVTPQDPIPFEKIAQICERAGRLNDAIQASLQAADLHIKNRDVDRAIENWVRVTRLKGDHLVAHSRLAVMYERLNRKPEAVEEYLAVASIVQHSGEQNKALQAVNYARQILPESPSVRKALATLQAGQTLPKPQHTKGGNGSLRLAYVRQMESSSGPEGPSQGSDPVSEGRQKALIALAEILFDQSNEAGEQGLSRRAPGSILRGNDGLSSEQAEQTLILRHLGLAIDAQTQENETLAARELGKAVEAGLDHPSAYFNLGYLTVSQEHPESGLRDLQMAVKHVDYALPGRLLLAQTLTKLGRLPEAAVEFLEALKIADSQNAPPEQSADIRQLYEPLIESTSQSKDQKKFALICENVNAVLMRLDWRSHIVKIRQQLPKPPEGSPPPIIAEMLLQAHGNRVVASLATIRNLTSQDLVRSAMEEAFSALQYAPTYLPLHIEMGELLLKEQRLADAINKFTIIAQAYSARGEPAQACTILNRLLQLSPMDVGVHKRLIDQYIASGQINEAIQTNLALANIFYRQADLETARKTYMSTLRLAQKSPDNHRWSIEILNKMADIDLQRLDLRQALRVFEQIRTMQPSDRKVRLAIIDLNFRMSQDSAAYNEVDGFINYLESNGQTEQVGPLLNTLIADHPEKPELRNRLAARNLAF